MQLQRDALDELAPALAVRRQPALFVCTHNSARSQLAAALWVALTEQPAEAPEPTPPPGCTPAPSKPDVAPDST